MHYGVRSTAAGPPPCTVSSRGAGGLLGLGQPRGSTQFAEATAGLTADGVILLMLPRLSFPRDSKCTLQALQTNKRVLCVYFPAAAFLLLRETAAFENGA